MLRGIDLPELFDAEAVDLRIDILVELEPLVQLPAQMSARALAKERVLRVQLHAELEVFGGLAVLADTHVARCDARTAPIVAVKHLGRRKAREDLDAERLGLLPQPARDIAQADDVVAVILEVVRERPIRRFDGALLGEKQEAVLGHRHVERRAFLLPVGNAAR